MDPGLETSGPVRGDRGEQGGETLEEGFAQRASGLFGDSRDLGLKLF